MNVSPAEVLLAYRQAKNALPQEQHGLGSTRLASSELSLDRLVRRAQRRASRGQWFQHLSIGEVRLAPKKSTRRRLPHIAAAGSVSSAATTRIDTRLNLTPSPSFATLEVLWLWSFGPALESLLTRSARANRLYLTADGRSVVTRSRWLFSFWREAYKKYRDDGLSVARSLLRGSSRECVVATLDLTSYYDNLDAGFLLEHAFVDELSASAALHDTPFNRQEYVAATGSLLEAYAEYRRAASRLIGRNLTNGIPIGSLASKVISNVALCSLDAHVATKRFEYYARYVDDILVVSRALPGAPSIRGLAAAILPIREEVSADGSLVVDETALQRRGSRLRLQKSKLKFYELNGDGGLDFLNVLQRDGRIIASERRAFLPPDGLGSQSPLAPLFVGRDDTAPVHALRDADQLRLGRYAASTMLARVETGIRLLEPEDAGSWASGQLRSVVNTLVDETHWLDYLDVGLRTFAICVRAGASSLARQIASAYRECVNQLEATENGAPLWLNGRRVSKTGRRELRRWIRDRLREEFCRSVPLRRGAALSLVKAYAVDCGLPELVEKDDDARRIVVDVARLRWADLRADDIDSDIRDFELIARRPDRSRLVEGLVQDASMRARLAAIDEFIGIVRQLGDHAYERLASLDLLLMAQPPSVFDVALLCAQAGATRSSVHRYVNAIRGTNYPLSSDKSSDPIVRLAIPGGEKDDPHVVLGNLPLAEDWFKAAARGQPRMPPSRAQDLNVIINEATARRRHRRNVILVLPELSVPRKWLRFLADRVVKEDVSLVAGLEYSRSGSSVRNEAVGIFTSGYSSAAVCLWKKTHPARVEERLLGAMGLQFQHSESSRVVVDTPYGAVSVLICSELLDVDERSRLRGAIDLLLVPSWNQDTSTFDHTIETAANDLHCYVGLSNEANGSDCRVHAPARKPHLRVASRLICRDTAASIATDIRIETLRKFQRDALESPDRRDKSFMPLPPGFKFRRP